MKQISISLLAALLIISCADSSKKTTITGSIDKLKRGIVYLQRIEDSTLINVDSLILDESGDFNFTTTVSEPEVMYILIDKDDNAPYNDRIEFFAENEAVTISSDIDAMDEELKITGGYNQQILSAFKKIDKPREKRRLGLLKERYAAVLDSNVQLVIELDDKLDKTLYSRYLVAGNYITKYRNTPAAAYLAAYKLPDAAQPYLEKLRDTLTDEVKSSKYGKEFLSSF